MLTHKQLPLALGLALGLHLPALAGPEAAPVQSAPSNSGDWCSWLQNKPGMLYKNKENPFIQEFQIEGRFQYQATYIDGSDVNGADFNETYDEYRRARLGAKGKFLQYFGFKYQVNLVDDGRPSGEDLDWGYADIDEAYLSFDLGKALGSTPFDELKLTYGRQKFLFSQEAHASSTKLLTVERSAISNRVYGSYRPTGLTLDAAKGPWTFIGSLYSSTTDLTEDNSNEAFNGWQDDVVYFAHVAYKMNDELSLFTDFVYNNADATTEDSVLSYRWATSIGAAYDAGKWGVMGDFIYGDNGDSGMTSNTDRQDEFWGVVVMPYYWLVDKKLQLVGQYQYQGADAAEGVRINSRYGRADGGGDVNSGRGDSHHSLYGGLNYYLCGHNAKLQAGIEYQTMDTPDGDFDTTTYVVAFRSFF